MEFDSNSNMNNNENKDIKDIKDENDENTVLSKSNVKGSKNLLHTSNSKSNRLNDYKTPSYFKWLILLLSCFSLMGNYYCFDIPGALKSVIKQQFINDSPEHFEYFFSLLYSLYSIPNIFLPLIGGYLIIKLGNEIVYILCSLFILIGQFLFCIGISNKSQILALIGRILFGFGGETINSTQSTIILYWFPQNQITFIFGISLSFARLFSVLNDVFSPRISSFYNIGTSVWIGFSICTLSSLITVLLVYLDWREKLKLKLKKILNTNSLEEKDIERNEEEIEPSNNGIESDSFSSVS